MMRIKSKVENKALRSPKLDLYMSTKITIYAKVCVQNYICPPKLWALSSVKMNYYYYYSALNASCSLHILCAPERSLLQAHEYLLPLFPPCKMPSVMLPLIALPAHLPPPGEESWLADWFIVCSLVNWWGRLGTPDRCMPLCAGGAMGGAEEDIPRNPRRRDGQGGFGHTLNTLICIAPPAGCKIRPIGFTSEMRVLAPSCYIHIRHIYI